MKGLRGLGWGLVAAGLAIGSTAAPPPAAAPIRHGRDVVLAADFHVHSFPGDGALPPWDLAVEAQRRGLDAIALTNHNHRAQWSLAQLVKPHAEGALLIPSEELTAAGYHMAAVGTRHDVSWRQDAASSVAAIHANGGVAIAAHPAERHKTQFDDRALDILDGVEVAHPLIYVLKDGRRDLDRFYARAKARKPTIAAIGSTDFHFFAPLGFCRTYVFARARSIDGVLDAVRRGATVACDASGNTIGPQDLAAVVADACRAAAGAPARGSKWADRARTIVVWCGLLILVVAGHRETSARS